MKPKKLWKGFSFKFMQNMSNGAISKKQSTTQGNDVGKHTSQSASFTDFFLENYNEILEHFNNYCEQASEKGEDKPSSSWNMRKSKSCELVFYGIGLIENYLADLLELYSQHLDCSRVPLVRSRFILMFNGLEFSKKLEIIAYLFNLRDYRLLGDNEKNLSQLNKLRNLVFHFQRPYSIHPYNGTYLVNKPNRMKDTFYSTEVTFSDFANFPNLLNNLIKSLSTDLYTSLRSWRTASYQVMPESESETKISIHKSDQYSAGLKKFNYLVVDRGGRLILQEGLEISELMP